MLEIRGAMTAQDMFKDYYDTHGNRYDSKWFNSIKKGKLAHDIAFHLVRRKMFIYNGTPYYKFLVEVINNEGFVSVRDFEDKDKALTYISEEKNKYKINNKSGEFKINGIL